MADTVKTQMPAPGSFVLGGEANAWRSRDAVTIAAGQGVLKAGTVLGKVTANGKFVASPLNSGSGVEGSETAIGILWQTVDATDHDVKAAAVTRDCEVLEANLYYGTTADTTDGHAAKKTQLEARGIILRHSS